MEPIGKETWEPQKKNYGNQIKWSPLEKAAWEPQKKNHGNQIK